jgi:ribosomal protein S18 acetylase RimI-like enzyme
MMCVHPRGPNVAGPIERRSVVIDAVRLRLARNVDVPILASMNQELIRAEGGPAHMTLGELTTRMRAFLEHGYEAHLVEVGEDLAGYALYRRDVDHVALRQFYVASRRRRSGVGRSAVAWLRDHAWQGARVVLQVRTGNEAALAFWQALGFEGTAVNLEWSPPSLGSTVR